MGTDMSRDRFSYLCCLEISCRDSCWVFQWLLLFFSNSHSGYVAIFNVEDRSEDRNPQFLQGLTIGDVPTFFHALADTYVLSITSLAPSYPNFLVVGSFDGIVQAVDIRCPESDVALVSRQRGIPPYLSH